MDTPAPKTQPAVESQQPATSPSPPTAQVKPIKKPTKLPIILMTVIAVLSLAVSAYFGYQNYLLKQQISQSPTASPSPTVDPTADWKTYTNTAYSYHLKYPNEWLAKSFGPGPGGFQLLNDSSRGVILSPNNQEQTIPSPSLQIEADGPENLSRPIYSEFQKQAKTGFSETYKLISETTTSFSGVTATVLEGEHVYSETSTYVKQFVFASSESGVYFSITIASDTKKESLVFDQILSTFKFLDETEDWETYTTPKLPKIDFPSVTFNYPPDWVVEDENDGLGTMNFKLSKNGYEITLYQAPMGSSVCLFDDSPEFEGPSGNLRTTKYTEIVSNIGILRYYIAPSNSQNYSFCVKSDEYFIGPLGIGDLNINTSTKIDTEVFQEAIDIIKLISVN